MFGEYVLCFQIATSLITSLNMLINKFTTGFSGEKVPRTPVVLKMAIQFRKKKAYIGILQLTKEPPNSDIYFIENIPTTSKNAAHVFTMWILLKGTHVVLAKKNILLFMVHS